MVPDQVGRFQMQVKIGGNERGAVYEAIDTDNNLRVAVKLLDARSLYTLTTQKKFTQQMAALKALKHPSILPLIDFGAEDNRPFIVMPLMMGNLEQRIQAETFTVEEALDLVGKIGSGLDYAAGNNYFHLELKPSNILFDEHGHPFIADLGLVQVINSLSAANKSTVNPYYMSPEQVRRRSLTVRSHEYSLAALLFHMLTGQVLFTGATELVAGFKHTSESPRSIRSLRSDLTKSFDKVIDRALKKNPEDRFSDCSTFVRMLVSALGGMITPEEVVRFEEQYPQTDDGRRFKGPQPPSQTRPQTRPQPQQPRQQQWKPPSNTQKWGGRVVTLIFVIFWLCTTLISCYDQFF